MTPSNNSGVKVQIAIILDDVGAKASDAKAFSLSKMVTFSILPHTDFSTDFSYWAAQQNREVMLHMPMESLHKVNLGEGPILAKMYPSEVEMALLNALQTVPHAVGVNNHMGSKLTQMTLQMTAMMEILEKNNMFFIDSRTTRFTKAKLIAQKTGVKTARRHIFLDHKQDPSFLNQQFDALIAKARKTGKAIGIGHPYPITLEFLATKLENLPKDVELITISNYLQETEKFRINPRLVSQQNSLNDKSLQQVMLPN
ncbi:divergent polysaccharide deacetylase family protein [Glaciecola petra]|uniref:Divergent polysaccharide deacetylase family protein n=1 Tax=Glaciecola petra TaxID=3075602 RepID=A0ABU2ZMI9_9ALTE|nr:divergent polysaccharide deacetylase family protein [Aestuariibacter sp. P117]MDT0593258.1 divergent polysaccharide deacetylase family protein [Aestuariibacter sp. P117]